MGLIGLILFVSVIGIACAYNILSYVPRKFEEQEEQTKRYFKELSIRINKFEDKLSGIKKIEEQKKERFKVKVAVHLILMEEEKVLLLRRFNTGYEDGNYSVVAGHLDGNEKVEEAMIREAKEEVGIDIKEEDLEVVCVMHRKAEDERIDYFLKAEKWSGEIKNMEPHKCDELKWHSLERVPKNIIPYVKRGIDNFANGIVFDQFGWED